MPRASQRFTRGTAASWRCAEPLQEYKDKACPVQDKKQHKLHDEDERHPDEEGGMLCFMSEHKDAEENADAGANQRKEEEGGLRDAISAAPGTALIGTHEKKARKIDEGKIGNQDEDGTQSGFSVSEDHGTHLA